MDSVKPAGIADWPVPTMVKQVRSFLGFTNFYRHFIEHYAPLIHPLNDLTKKNLTWNWSDDCQKSFKDLKTRFQKAPILLMPDNKKPFIMETDASKWATGGVLHQ